MVTVSFPSPILYLRSFLIVCIHSLPLMTCIDQKRKEGLIMREKGDKPIYRKMVFVTELYMT